jgi:hypothetical protein
MNEKKLIRYRLPVSVKFPATHPRKGCRTWFDDKIELALNKFEACHVVDHHNKESVDIWPKLHTIRGNYTLWTERFEKINKGEAVLELYYWDGKPYGKGVKQITICQLGKDDGIGIQCLDFLNGNFSDPVAFDSKSKVHLTREQLAKNDGLSLDDFTAWFKGFDLSETMAIIHFTPFRY